MDTLLCNDDPDDILWAKLLSMHYFDLIGHNLFSWSIWLLGIQAWEISEC